MSWFRNSRDPQLRALFGIDRHELKALPLALALKQRGVLVNQPRASLA
jgi:hypothetical protein